MTLPQFLPANLHINLPSRDSLHGRAKGESMKLVVFDNDGTLYDDNIVGSRFGEICERYVVARFGVSPDEGEARQFLKELKQKWQTPFSVIALNREFEVDFEEIVEATYLQIDLTACRIRKDSAKLETLKAVPHTKVVLTNNPMAHARRVLRHIGLEDCFKRVVGMENLIPHLKPDPEAYRVVETMYPNHEYIFIDDSITNLDAARECDWKTIWYREITGLGLKNCDHATANNFNKLPDLIG